MHAYVQMARRLSRYWKVPFPTVLLRMMLGRLLYKRGPTEFDMFRFATKPVVMWRHYMPQAERLRLQEMHAPPSSRIWEEDKLRFAERCRKHGLPCAPVTAVIPALRDGVDTAHAPDVARITSAAMLRALFTSLRHFDGFAKPLGGGAGYGAFGFRIRDGTLVPSRHHADAEQMFTACATSRFPGGGYLLQPRLLPHASLLPFMPGPGLGTVRIYSFLNASGEVSIPLAGLRVPAAGAECDNHQYDASYVLVDVETGVFGAAVGFTTAQPISHEIICHPETAATFSGGMIPCWPEVLTLVRAAATAFSMLPALGWDVAVTPDGPLLVETNWQFGPQLAERLTNRGWADELRTLYAHCPST